MKEYKCENCSLRKQYDKKPGSLRGRLWKWHIGWCPGWKGYLKSLDQEKRDRIIALYGKSK